VSGQSGDANDVIILSTSTSSPSCIVKFDVTQKFKKKKLKGQLSESSNVFGLQQEGVERGQSVWKFDGVGAVK
jgi:hypothetical protein